MIVKEYLCAAHGDFDAGEPKCPQGCGGSMVQRVFRTAPTIQSAGYRNMNRTFNSLAQEHGLSNMRNAPGQSMRRAGPEVHDRLNRATELIIGAGRAAQGMDAGQFFKPMSAMSGASVGGGGVLHRENGRMNSGGIPIPTPGVRLDAPAYDGRANGVPAGEAA